MFAFSADRESLLGTMQKSACEGTLAVEDRVPEDELEEESKLRASS
jgi:hypothetical protein